MGQKKIRPRPGPHFLQILRQLAHNSQLQLLHTINEAWITGILLNDWTSPTVITIPKAGKSQNHISHFQPVSLTSRVGKL